MSARGDILNNGYSDLQGDVQQSLLKHYELPSVIFFSPQIACGVSKPFCVPFANPPPPWLCMVCLVSSVATQHQLIYPYMSPVSTVGEH